MRHVTVQQLSAFLDGALAGVSRDLVTRHLAACADCRERHALWHIYDEVLQRVLSWEPNERTMEEASTRVELTLTAERRGLPPPEFTSVLQPVIAATPAPGYPAKPGPSASPSSLFPTLPPIPASAAAAAPPPPPPPPPVPAAHAPYAPPPPPPAPPPPAAPYTPPAPPPPPVQWSPPPPPAPPPPPPPPVQWSPPPPVTAVSTWTPPPASHAPYAPQQPGPPSGATPSARSFPLDPPESAASPSGYPAQPGPPVSRYVPPAPVTPVSPARGADPYDDRRALPERPSVAWASVPLPKQRKKRHRLLVACVLLLVAFVLATPWMPDVIRIQLPASYEPRVPRVEIVPHGRQPAPLDPQLHLAERTSSAQPASGPYRALPAATESAAAEPSAIESVAATAAVTPPPVDEPVSSPPVEAAPPPKPYIPPPSPNPPPRNPDAANATSARAVTTPAHAVTTPAHRARKQQQPSPPARKPAPPRTRPTPPVASRPEDEGGTAAGAENSMTFVPVQVKTEVRLSPTQPTATAAPAAEDTAGDQAMPLLCGEVVDETGAPIEGARVQLTAPPLTVRTDKRGRFCVACPAGERTFLVDAPGYVAVTRGVELTGATFETHVSLSPAR